MTDRITIRAARTTDPAVARLAVLDSAPPVAEPTLVAERDGVPIAAMAYDGRTVVADPFTATADAVALLAERAAQMRGDWPAASALSWRREDRSAQRARRESRRRLPLRPAILRAR